MIGNNLFETTYLWRAGRGLDKIDMLLDVAAELQDRNPESRSYGNFRWYVRDGFVMDYNAVDFCMQAGSLIARDYRDRLTPGQRAKFDKLCELAIKGSLSHCVRSSYTNIALMNAVNLVLLGEAYGLVRKDRRARPGRAAAHRLAPWAGAYVDVARISRRYHVAEGHRDADPPHARRRREGGRAAADDRSVLPAKGLTAEMGASPFFTVPPL